MKTLPLEVDVPVPPNRFLPEGFDAAELESVRRRAQELLERQIDSPRELARWIGDWGELGDALEDAETRRQLAYDRDTRDEAAEREHMRFLREVQSPWRELDDALNRRLLASPHADGLDDSLALFLRGQRETAALFRPENLPRKEREREIESRWGKLQGAIAVELDGEMRTSSQCEARLYLRDGARREAAYRALGRRRLEDRDAIDALLDETVSLRHQIARSAGCRDYIEYRFRELHRFDYTPDDCETFARAVEREVVPFVRELRAQRAATLGIERTRPWDQRVNVHTEDDSPLFEDEEQFVSITARLIEHVSPALRADFDILQRNDLLDLYARPGKGPGGYCAPMSSLRLPFLFVNAVGTSRDLVVLLHEGGHALHTIAAREQEPAAYRDCGYEFSEVASMSMELFGTDAFPAALPPARARALALEQYEGVALGLCRTALCDAFQRWMYAHPAHSRDERRRVWVELSDRLAPGIDWTGLEDVYESDWQRVPHFFGWPLYYIEYGLAQLGALQVWRNYRRDPEPALAAYRHALSLGGSRPLPELFEAAGARFGMDAALVAELTGELRAAYTELRETPQG